MIVEHRNQIFFRLQRPRNCDDKVQKKHHYGCMPTIQVYEIDEKEIKEIDIEKIPKDCFEDGYVSKKDILCRKNKKPGILL